MITAYYFYNLFKIKNDVKKTSLSTAQICRVSRNFIILAEYRSTMYGRLTANKLYIHFPLNTLNKKFYLNTKL